MQICAQTNPAGRERLRVARPHGGSHFWLAAYSTFCADCKPGEQRQLRQELEKMGGHKDLPVEISGCGTKKLLQ